MYASDEKWKVDQFIFGLRVEIDHSVSQRGFTTYAKLLRQCYVIEDSLKRILEEGDQYRFSQKDQGCPTISLSLNIKPSKESREKFKIFSTYSVSRR